jgi:phospholipase/carboxylesterase
LVSAAGCGENGGMNDITAASLLDTVEQETGPSPQWSVLWLHGLGADGHDFAPLVPELVRPGWPALRFVFPHAPVRAVTINNGVRMRAWYDIVGMDFPTRADSTGIEESIVQVEALIAREQARGIAPERLLLAGFSQGGAITLAAGLRRQVPLAGLIALSTYLPAAGSAAAHLAQGANTQPVFMAHGTGDPVIPLMYAEQSAQALKGLGFDTQWQRYPMAHQVCAEEIRDLGDWMQRRFAL